MRRSYTLALAAGTFGVAMGLLVVLTERPRPVAPARALAPPSVAEVASRAAQLRAEPLPPALEALRALAAEKTPPAEGDWLAEHPEEGQSLAEHREACLGAAGRTVYLVPTGAFAPEAREVFDALGPLLAAHFQLPVKTLAPLPASVAGRSARERELGPQWLTRDILEALRATRPDDAAAVMAVTMVDLYPDPTWNFVFGEATWEDRVAVMSLSRSGDPALERALVLERAFSTAAHEVGHMFQLAHCVAWECPMNGTNHLDEADSRPLEPCPHCLAKLIHATGLVPEVRWRELRAASLAAGLERGVEAVDRSLAAVDAGSREP